MKVVNSSLELVNGQELQIAKFRVAINANDSNGVDTDSGLVDIIIAEIIRNDDNDDEKQILLYHSFTYEIINNYSNQKGRIELIR